MAANPFAALLDGVPHMIHFGKDGDGIKETKLYAEEHVLAALAAAYPADLAEAGKRAAYIANECQQAAKVMEETGTFPTGQAIFRDASAQITALLARIAAQEAVNKGLEQHVADLLADQECGCGYDKPTDVCLGHLPLHRKTVARAEAAETALAAERKKTAKLVEALTRAADLMERHNLSGGLVSDLRAAITEASQ